MQSIIKSISVTFLSSLIFLSCNTKKQVDENTSTTTKGSSVENVIENAEELPIIIASAPQNKFTDWGNEPIEPVDGPPESWTWPHLMCDGPQAESVKVSSFLPAQGKYNYVAANLCDDDPRTAWVEGKDDYGVGESFEMTGWIPMGSGEIGILNGYQINRSSWENNSRVKKLKVSINEKDVCILELNDVMGIQTFNLPVNALKMLQGETKVVHSNSEVPKGVSSINDGNGNIQYTVGGGGNLKFTIMDVFPGKKWKDTAITGIFSCGG